MRFYNQNGIERYIRAHPDLLNLLANLRRGLLSRLPSSTQCSLKLYQDPEFDDEHLVLSVSAQDDWDDTLTAIDETVDALSDEFAACSGYVTVTPVSEA